MNAPLVKELNAAFRALVREVEIVEIVPVGFFATAAGSYPEPGVKLEADVDSTLAVARDDSSARHFLVRGDFNVSAREATGADKREDSFLDLRYTVLSRYVVPESFPHPLEDGLIRQFAETNAILHLWPYLRAFVSSACGQLGAPHVLLHVLRQPMIKQASSTKSE